MRSVTVEEMRRHVTQLLEKHHVLYSWCARPSTAWGSREIWEVQIAPIRSELSYATALHEFGHLLGAHQASRDSMVREHWAWRWARRHAIAWTPRMQKDSGRCLEFTLANRRRVPPTLIAAEVATGRRPRD